MIGRAMYVHIMIPTYNRRRMLYRLLAQIGAQMAGGPLVTGRVFDDHTPEDVPRQSDMPGWAQLTRFKRHYGKRGYWEMVSHMFAASQPLAADAFIMLPDDVVLEPGFLSRALEIWSAIEDPRKACLNPLLDPRAGRAQWIPHEVTKKRFGEHEVWHSQWNDLAFICGRGMMEALHWEVKPISPERWTANPLLSSGVGAQITQRLDAAGMNMYQVTDILMRHGDHSSEMNPDERERNPLIT